MDYYADNYTVYYDVADIKIIDYAETERNASDIAYTESCRQYEYSLDYDYWLQFPRWLFCVVGLLGNVLEILIFRSREFGGHRKQLIFMAVVDLLSLTCGIASLIMSLVLTDEFPLTAAVVKIALSALIFTLRNAAMLLLAGTSFARYRSLASPFRREKSHCPLIFLATLASSVPALLILTLILEVFITYESTSDPFVTRFDNYNVAHNSTRVLICTLSGTLLVVFNVRAVLNVRNRPVGNPNTRVCVKIIALSSAVFILMSTLPKATISILSLLHPMGSRNFDCSWVTANAAKKVLAILDVLHSSCFDNLIFFLFSKTYRTKARTVLKQMFFGKGRRQTRAPQSTRSLVETWV